MGRIEFLDFAKGFAILSIMLFHYLSQSATGLTARAVEVGGTGVHLFIIMSGFGLSLSLYSVSYGAFYKRRFVKILAPYYLWVTLLFIVNKFYVIYPGYGLYAYLGHILWYKMFDESIVRSFGYHLWFLSTIIQLYLVYPFLRRLQEQLGNTRVFTVALGISITYWTAIMLMRQDDVWIFNRCFLQYLWEFVGAMVLADLYKKRGYKFWEQRRTVLLAVGLVGFGLMGALAMAGGSVGRVTNDIPAAIGYTAIVACVYAISKGSLKFLKTFIKFVGAVSYELYLVHVLVATLAARFLFHHGDAKLSYVEAMLTVLVAIIVALVYRQVSQGAIRLVVNLVQSKQVCFSKRVPSH